MLLCAAPLRSGAGRLRPVVSVAVLVLRNAQLAQAQARVRSARSYSSDHAHHEARIESVRNIGIIAHVDAVTEPRCLTPAGTAR
jgi:elongation factor G